MTKPDALDKLIIDEDKSPDIEILAEIITENLKFTKSGEIIFERKFYELKDWQKTLIYLLARKVILLKKLKSNFDEKVSYKEIAKLFGLKEASVRKYISKELKGIVKTEKGQYFIPNYNLYKCKEQIIKNERKTISKRN